MKDPERLVDRAGSLDARLLSALDEPAPPELLARTLASLSVASVAPAALAPSGAKVVAAKVAGGGILSAIGIGALAGVVTVALSQWAPLSGALSQQAPQSGALAHQATSTRNVDVAAGPLLAPPAVMASSAPAVTSAPVVAPPSSAEAPAGSARAPAPSASPSMRSPATLATEIALLDEARRALDGGDPARAQALMDRYAREAPHGQLAREAALLRAEVAKAIAPTNP